MKYVPELVAFAVLALIASVVVFGVFASPVTKGDDWFRDKQGKLKYGKVIGVSLAIGVLGTAFLFSGGMWAI